jgi:hypothetical protein
VHPSDWIALASLVVAFAALGISIYAIIRANATTSAATFVTLNEGFRQSWDRCLQPGVGQGAENVGLPELLNLLEIACAIYLEGSVSGNSRKLIAEYLNSVLSLLTKSPVLNPQVLPLLQTEETFIFIKKFLRKRRSVLSVTIPPEWYELQS